jgi:phosphomannomutase
LLDRLAAHFGEPCIEVPVGFKHIASAMVAHKALLGGESSGGLTIRGHILGKDGIFASALVVEMLARTHEKISQLRQRVYDITGRLYSLEESIPATSGMRVAVPRRLAQTPLKEIGSCPVVKLSQADGTKFYLGNDNWALVRFSGTEPILRLFAEADSPEKASALLQQLLEFVTQ